MSRQASALVLWTTLLSASVGVAAERPPVARCATHELRRAIGDAHWTAPSARAGLPCAHTPVGPPPNPQIGSSWNWYIWRLNGFPVADLKSCTVRGMGDHCYVVVEDSQWNVNVDQTQVDTIVDHFENTSIGSFPGQGIWDLDTAHFGDPPDNLDQDPRVYILYYDFDVASDGYFWGFDQECDDVAQFHSNECDVVYMNCSDFDPAGSYLLAVLAHEFEHLIHFNYDQDELAWVDEGLAELAMWLYGDPDDISQFNTNPDRQLTSFGGAWYDYIKTYLWSLYFYERYGGQASVRAVVQEPANSILGYDHVLDAQSYTENFTDVFGDWVVANYLDDPSIGDGRFGYAGETLPPFNPFATFSTYPVGPNNASVNHWAADYVRYLNGAGLLVTFNGSDNNKFRVRALLLDPVAATEVIDMPLGPGEVGELALPQVGTTHEELVMVHAGIQDTGTLTYQYGAEAGAVVAPLLDGSATLSIATLGNGSSRPELVIGIPEAAAGRPSRLDVVDVQGRVVRRLSSGAATPGRHRVTWDARDGSNRRVAAGVYFARLAVGEDRATARVTLVR
ncbi:MAG: FlgD immunoglobulin-like domain containing protein [bacterium]